MMILLIIIRIFGTQNKKIEHRPYFIKNDKNEFEIFYPTRNR